ncbi:MAG: bifunctional DNA-formamidopyrimidine glycosylase/DNA-(apurinic or apyrimidinic site) lyase [Propionibacteriaceae bacterium]
MPELPEVETVRQGLVTTISGRTIDSVEVLNTRSVRRHESGPSDFADSLVGCTVTDVCRRGKYLWFALDDGDAVLAHLGMSGQFRVDKVDTPLLRHTRVVLRFADGDTELRFVDQRMFGGMSLSEGGSELPDEIAHIARDPFDPLFSQDDAVTRLMQRRGGLKRVLLDQTWVSGIGNIYADEALWRAKLHGEQPAHLLSYAHAGELIRHICDVLAEALAQGGTSFDALYVNVNGESGYFDRTLNAYGREGEPCLRCGTAIVREKFANRSSHRCPKCQRLRLKMSVPPLILKMPRDGNL